MFPIRDSIPTRHPSFVTWTLITVNIVIFGFELMLEPEALDAFIYSWASVPITLNPSRFGLPDIALRSPTLITCMFLHGGFMHVAGNMWMLYIFGNNVEDKLGHVRYLFFYLFCGLVASIVQTFFSFSSEIPILGASGAISGVMGGYLLAFPKARVQTLFVFIIIFKLIWIPAVVYLGIWFLFQFWQALVSLGVSPETGGGIAFWAHAGGFAAGMILIGFLREREPAKWFVSAEDDRSNYPPPRRRLW